MPARPCESVSGGDRSRTAELGHSVTTQRAWVVHTLREVHDIVLGRETLRL